MWEPSRHAKTALLLIVMLVICAIACGREDKFVGAYHSLPDSPPGYPEVYLELRNGGEGVRRVGEETIPFRWNVKGNEIRIHTRSGGVIVGTMQKEDVLAVNLPGSEIAYLKKIK
jgi:hypothetical protein